MEGGITTPSETASLGQPMRGFDPDSSLLPELPVLETDVLSGLPSVPTVSACEVARAVAASRTRLVVLDDDSTGTQTVADVPGPHQVGGRGHTVGIPAVRQRLLHPYEYPQSCPCSHGVS
jgi:hypothetical protein